MLIFEEFEQAEPTLDIRFETPKMRYNIRKHPSHKSYEQLVNWFITKSGDIFKLSHRHYYGDFTVDVRRYKTECSYERDRLTIDSKLYLIYDKETGLFCVYSTMQYYMIDGKKEYKLSKAIEQFFQDLYRFKQTKIRK